MLKRFTILTLSLFVLIASLYLSNHYHNSLIMSPSPEPEQPLMSLDEYITLCADLHNTLLAKSIPLDSPLPETSTNLLQRYESYRANPPFDPFPNDPGPPPS